MKRSRLIAVAVVALLSLSSFADEAAEMQRWQRDFDQQVLPIMQSRCADCHMGDEADGAFDLAKFQSGEAAAANLDLWDRVGKRVRLKEMPPEGSPQLNDSQKAILHRWLDSRPKADLCSKIASDETQAWYRGVVMSRRLTRTEFYNAIEHTVGIPADPRFEIPSDGAGGEGFDTNGDTLFTSPIHVEQYLASVSDVVDRVLSDTSANPSAKSTILFTSPASSDGEPQVSADQAANAVLARFARRAWRRPVESSELERLMQLFQASYARQPDFVPAIAEPLKAVLLSPNFLFVVESESPEGGVQRLTPHQLAMRLSLFLWSSVPDDELLNAADSGELQTQEQILVATRRMLKDRKSLALGENFGLQWLGLSNFLTTVRPDAEVYPEYSETLARDMQEEAIRTIASVFIDDGSLLELVDADRVHVNGRLAQHYGMDLDAAANWQVVDAIDTGRGGVVTLAATLMSTSYPRRTSPVLRGRWLLEEILGSKVPPPPANVPALEEAAAEQVVSLRERLEIHRQNPDCASCHNRMDPLGFGLENFDALGRWRTSDHGVKIDATGTLPSGDSFEGPAELKQVILRRSHDFEKHFVKKLLGFALGRELNKFDECVIEDSLKALNQNDHRATAVIETIVTSFPFQHRYFKAATE